MCRVGGQFVLLLVGNSEVVEPGERNVGITGKSHSIGEIAIGSIDGGGVAASLTDVVESVFVGGSTHTVGISGKHNVTSIERGTHSGTLVRTDAQISIYVHLRAIDEARQVHGEAQSIGCAEILAEERLSGEARRRQFTLMVHIVETCGESCRKRSRLICRSRLKRGISLIVGEEIIGMSRIGIGSVAQEICSR